MVALLESVFVAMASCGHGSSCWRQPSVPVGGSAAELAPQNVVPDKEGWAQLDAVHWPNSSFSKLARYFSRN